MWAVVTAACASAYYAQQGSAAQQKSTNTELDWEREQIRRKHERDAEDRKIRRQGMYGTMLLIAFALSVGYFVSGFFA